MGKREEKGVNPISSDILKPLMKNKEYKGFEITKELKKNPIIKIGEKVMLNGMPLKIVGKSANNIIYNNYGNTLH